MHDVQTLDRQVHDGCTASPLYVRCCRMPLGRCRMQFVLPRCCCQLSAGEYPWALSSLEGDTALTGFCTPPRIPQRSGQCSPLLQQQTAPRTFLVRTAPATQHHRGSRLGCDPISMSCLSFSPSLTFLSSCSVRSSLTPTGSSACSRTSASRTAGIFNADYSEHPHHTKPFRRERHAYKFS